MRPLPRALTPLALLPLVVLAGCQSAPSVDLWRQLPEPTSFREDTIDNLSELVERSDLVIEGEIVDIAIRDRGVWSEPQGPDDLAIFAEDIVLTVHATDSKDSEDIEIRIERLYDEQPGSGPLDERSLKMDSDMYVFALINDEHAVALEADGPGYRCTDEADFCGLTFSDGILYTTPRHTGEAVPVSTLLPDAGAVTSFADIHALAAESGVTALS